MNMQKRADLRSLALHKAIVKKLRSNPSLWAIPRSNLARWKKMRGGLPNALVEWEEILNCYPKDKILSLLESDSEEAIRLRSSSPFTGILTEAERKRIFERYRLKESKRF
ncbi:MAG: hypothetical protein ONB32_16865 [candidate division KSB1 bacterium]|nr:hypothetical protein [candidate division KSB1 bacterium]